MAQFQIAFREMLVQENLCSLADAMHRKLKRELGRDASLEVVVQPLLREARCSVQLRVVANNGAQRASAETHHTNPVTALRRAFEQAHGALWDAHAPDASYSAAESRAASQGEPRTSGTLLLFRRENHGQPRAEQGRRAPARAYPARERAHS